MQGISIFKQTYAAGASRVVMGFDSAINTYSPYAIGCIVGKSYAMAAAVVNEDSDQWHIVNLNTKHGFDAVAVLGAIDEDAAASIAMRDFGRFKESAMWDSVIATNTGGLKRYIDSPLCVKGRKVFTGEIGAMQDMAAGQKILWDGICLQSHQGSIRVLLSDMVQHDDESALVEKFDGLNAWLAESDVEVMEFDALVVENYRLEQTMAKLASAMGAASGQGGVSVTNVTQTKAVKLRNSGAIQVGVSFELSDGQTVTAIFNHADSETQKLGLKDTLFSWKWKLNSRDISAAVQPNNFENVKLDILAKRIMKLVNANSARFQRSQAKKLENEQALADGNARIAEKKATIESLKSEIESLHIQADEKAKADQAAIETKVEDQPQEPEQHYSDKIIAQLIRNYGWKKTDSTTSAEKEFAGLAADGLLSDGGRIVYATFIGDAKRYLSLQLGYDDIFDMDMRPYGGDDEAIADGAKEFNAKVEAWVLDKRGVGVAAKDGDGDGEPIVLTGKELGDFPDTDEGKKALRKAAKAELMSIRGKPVYCTALGHDVDIAREGVNKITSLSGDERKLKIATVIRQLIANAAKDRTTKPYVKAEIKKGVVAYHIMRGMVTLDEDDLYVRFVVKEKSDGHFQYDYTVSESTLIFDSIEIGNASQQGEAFDATNYKSAGQLEPTLLASSQPDTLTRGKDITSQDENLVNEFDAAGEKYVLNLFIQVKDEHGNWVDLDDEDDFKAESEAAADDFSMETKISKQDQGVDMSIDANFNVEKTVAPLPQEIDIVNLEKMGVVQITEQGSENIYFVKDGREYYAKVQNTEDYPVGEFDLGQYPQGLPRTSAVDPLDTEEAPMPAINLDADYLNSIINGFNFAAADLDELESKLEAISERLTPETEDLFEQAAEAFAQYAISLEV